MHRPTTAVSRCSAIPTPRQEHSSARPAPPHLPTNQQVIAVPAWAWFSRSPVSVLFRAAHPTSALSSLISFSFLHFRPFFHILPLPFLSTPVLPSLRKRPTSSQVRLRYRFVWNRPVHCQQTVVHREGSFRHADPAGFIDEENFAGWSQPAGATE